MTKNQKNYGEAKVKPLDKSRIEIIGNIPPEIWENYRAQALKEVNDSVTIDGFRKGMVPENILISKVGEMAILEEMAELAMTPAYMDIVIENKIDAIGRPDIQITKLASGNPIEFKIVSAIVPTVTLPEYKKIAVEEVKKQNPDDVKVTEKDIEDTITRILSETESADTAADRSDHKTLATKNELNDDFVKKLGAFSSVSDFKEKLKEMIAQQKKDQAIEKLRIQIAENISSASTIDLPDIMVDSETSRIEAQFGGDIERMGVKLEDYLKHSKKTIEDLRKEWRPHAEKKAKLQLILNAIADKEKLRPSKDEIEHEVKHILEHYKDADHEQAHSYAETVLTNEKVFQFLESK
ncbi:MAG: trigger factor [Candidatus Paceibacterota bacterium]|jgi:FKBP-type peptidyl-prolyl cis-trans isomerase (trigger factor)